MDNIVSKVTVLIPYFAFMLELRCINLYGSTKPICIIDNLLRFNGLHPTGLVHPRFEVMS